MRENSACIVLRPDGRYQCSVRGIVFSVHAKPPIQCVCDATFAPQIEISVESAEEFDADLSELGVIVESDHQRKSLWSQWREAVGRWKNAGKPKRTEEEIQNILAMYCNPPGKPCAEFGYRLMVIPMCKACGCNLQTPGIGELSKLKMRTEKCPKGYWS